VTSVLNTTKSASATVTVTLDPTPSIKITPATASLFPAAGKTFTAEVKGLVNTQVLWSVQEPNGGVISSSGVYLAPSVSGVYTVVATSASNSTVLSTAKVNVGNVLVFPDDGLTVPTLTKQFTTSLAPGVAGTITWSVDEGDAGGTITPDGVYTAPLANGIFHVRATLDSGDAGTAPITVGLIDAIVVAPAIQVNVDGTYRVSGTLKSSNGNTLEKRTRLYLPQGAASPELVFEASQIRAVLGVDGPYQIAELMLEREADDPVLLGDRKTNVASTLPAPLRAFQQPWVQFMGTSSAVGVDLNSNGLADFLQIDLGVQAFEADFYDITAILKGVDGQEIVMSQTLRKWIPAGVSTISLLFDGRAISAAGVLGPYTVEDVALTGRHHGGIEIAATVTGFQPADFEPPTNPALAPLALNQTVSSKQGFKSKKTQAVRKRAMVRR
jgi:hypothetical protein